MPQFLSLYEANAANLSRPYPGVPETLVDLRRRGYRTAVCSNKAQRATLAVLNGLALLPLFDGIAGGDHFVVRKPDPGHLLGALFGSDVSETEPAGFQEQRDREEIDHVGVDLEEQMFGGKD